MSELTEEMAQERMYGLREREDVLRAIMKVADQHLAEVYEQKWALLSDFPTLSLQQRPLPLEEGWKYDA